MATRRNLWLAGALLGLVVLVAVASRGALPGRRRAGRTGSTRNLIWEFILIGVLRAVPALPARGDLGRRHDAARRAAVAGKEEPHRRNRDRPCDLPARDRRRGASAIYASNDHGNKQPKPQQRSSNGADQAEQARQEDPVRLAAGDRDPVDRGRRRGRRRLRAVPQAATGACRPRPSSRRSSPRSSTTRSTTCAPRTTRAGR